jgi:hypothetical protein
LRIYQEYNEKYRAIFIKLKDDTLVQDIVGRTFEANYKFDSGSIVKVQTSEANGNLKYVRIFNLIAEVDDEHIEQVLKDYSTEKKQIREKFPASFGVGGANGTVRDSNTIFTSTPASSFLVATNGNAKL